MKSRALVAILGCLLVVVLIAACGGGVSHRHATITPRATVRVSRCTPADETMGCVLATVGAPAGIAPRATGSTYGIDFAWSSVSAARAKAVGARFGASYLSTDAGKNWTAANVNAYHAAGLATVAVWETYATRAQAGYAAGRADAISARSQAAALGNTNRPIDFAVDCACAPSSVLGYFQGVHSILGARDDAYGDYAVIRYLHAHGVVGSENWQTYAWSGGAWLPASIAPLEQYLNGSTFDNDRALAPLYGQWPAPKAHPARKPLPRCIHKREAAKTCVAVKAKIASQGRAVAASKRVLAQALKTERVMRHRISWFTRAQAQLRAAN